MQTTKKPTIAKFTCFVTKDTDVSPEALKLAIPHVYRGVEFKEKDRDSIQALFRHKPISNNLLDGFWLFEKTSAGEYGFRIKSRHEVAEKYKKFDASGILGQGSGSERFI